ncbi:MAG TPA: DUF309 domain-containing protein, partial [Pyrinomonadaceae bacterium]|nr:DUF309 domain-containing protein [Pyrinomonadaceae bacterium]
EAFYEAHEVLEDLWLECAGDQKRFYQALIQCAVAFAHVQRKNPKGARQVATRALAVLKTFERERETILVEKLVSECEAFFEKPESTFPRIQTSSD